MLDSSISETTHLLRAWADGDEQALEALIPRVYSELRRLAGRFLQNEQPGQTLQVSDLVHEAYLHLADLSRLDWQHRNHFFAVSATLMRRILVDRARRRLAAKRGGVAQGPVKGVDLERVLDVSSKRPAEIVALDEALDELARLAPRKARIVELRFFAGLGVKETAELVGVSQDTVTRDWRMARAWLLKELSAA
jgi:RNA polymerase sigma factor (TIGR02999 family)